MAIYYGDGSNSNSGRIIQTVQSNYNSQIEWNDNNSRDLMTLAITPKATSSRIMIIVSCNGCGSRSSDTYWNMWIRKGGSALYTVASYIGIEDASNGDSSSPNANYIDVAGSTSSITYSVTGQRTNGSYNIIFNHSNSQNMSIGGSSLTLMEMAA
mgnify:CR=1 FL=1|tara:strand:+ start:81 stop:545 length:465 start_codon:yes stop_codon:yes gene_type:complete